MESKAKIVAVQALALHHDTGATVPYKKFLNAKSPDVVLGENATGEKIGLRAVLDKLRSWDLYVDDPTARKTNQGVMEWLSEHGDSSQVTSDNTYNWSWWGPTLNFMVVNGQDDASDPMHAECLIFARAHLGGDVRGNYGNYSVYLNEEFYNCFHPWHLVVNMTTSDGKTVTLESEDDEAYRWICVTDETGTLDTDGHSYKRDEILELFEVDIKGASSYARKDPFEAIL